MVYASAGNDGGMLRAMWRLAGWLLFVLLLPVATAPFWLRLLDNESNADNAFALAFLTLVDAALAWGLLGFPLTRWPMLVPVAFALGIAAAWNFFALNLLETRRAGVAC
jgi:hypothetical protein